MDRWDGLEGVPAGAGPSVVTIGVFDGVHRGHRLLVARAVALARERAAAAVVTTFDPHPVSVLRPGEAPAALATPAHRLRLLAGLGVDATLVLPFTRELASWEPERLVRDLLVERLGTVAVAVGEDFRFGARACGDVATLRRLGAAHGFAVDAVSLLAGGAGGARVSSTQVRRLVAEGDVEAAARALARPHRVEGPVVTGDRRGRTLGYPTANVEAAPGAAVPADGVYAGWLLRDAGRGERLAAAVSIGTNPTFTPAGLARRVEAYVLDRDDLALYGEHVALDFLARLRATRRFDSTSELLEQMARDVARTRELTTGA